MLGRRRWIRRLPFVVLGVFITIYTIYTILPYAYGPRLIFQNINPEELITTDNAVVSIQAQAPRVAFLEIDRREVPLRSDRTVQTDLFVPPGYSIINITARDRYGRTRHYMLHVLSNRPQAGVSDINRLRNAPIPATTTSSST